jgi:hypothetical protein
VTPFAEPLHVQIQQAADLMRQRARAAANNTADSWLCCWIAARAGARDVVLEVRGHRNGEDIVVVTVPAVAGTAEHIAGADPQFMLLLAGYLDREAAWCHEHPEQCDSPHLAVLRDLVDQYMRGDHYA